jgi:hypothetical protein
VSRICFGHASTRSSTWTTRWPIARTIDWRFLEEKFGVGKGKPHKPYEFGVKVSLATTLKRCKGGQFAIHAQALPGKACLRIRQEIADAPKIKHASPASLTQRLNAPPTQNYR